jgi:hypothetical protein
LENLFTPYDLCDEHHERQVQVCVQALLEAEEHPLPPERIRPSDVQKLIQSLKLRKACGINVILNECLRHLPRRPLVHLTHLFNHCFRFSHSPFAWKEAKVITLPKPGKDPQFPKKFTCDKPPVHKLFVNAIQKIVHMNVDEQDLLNASQYGFRACHSTTLQCMRLADYVTLSFNKNISMATVFLDIQKAFDTTWHPGLLHKSSKLQFSENLLQLISLFLTSRNIRVTVEDELSTL